MATTMLNSNLKERLKAALDQLPDADIEAIGFQRDLLLDVLNRVVQERSVRAAHRVELSDIMAQLGQERAAQEAAREALAALKKERSDDPWDLGRRTSEVLKVIAERKVRIEELERATRLIKRVLEAH
jgi:predicted nucleic acid-binding protein